MSDSRIVASIVLGLIAAITGGLALVLLGQTLGGLGAAGLALTGVFILGLGAVCGLSLRQIVALNARPADAARDEEETRNEKEGPGGPS